MSILKKITKKDDGEKKAAKKPAASASKKEVKKPAEETAPQTAGTPSATGVLIRPLLSEKALTQEADGMYTFIVNTGATRVDIKRAVKERYGVLPKKVRVMNYEGKRTRFGRLTGKRSDWKKAVVTLPQGQTISVHEGV